MAQFLSVDPGDLFLPPTQPTSTNPAKLARQVAKFRDSLAGMPPLQVIRGRDGHLRINDGVTRATRAAKLRPGELVVVEVIQDLPGLNVTRMPRVRNVLP
jgi:hypothetical protein